MSEERGGGGKVLIARVSRKMADTPSEVTRPNLVEDGRSNR